MSNPEIRYSFSGAAVPTTITGQVLAGGTTCAIADATGWPDGSQGPFWVTHNRGKANEERAIVLDRTGLVLTYLGSGRGKDGTVPADHDSGETIEHTWSGELADLANKHTASTSGVHGVNGNVVGTTDTQELRNKTIDGTQNSVSNLARTAVIGLDGDINDLQAAVLANTLSIGNEVTNRAAADALLQALSEKGANNGYAPLDGSGKVPLANLPTTPVAYATNYGNADVSITASLGNILVTPSIPVVNGGLYLVLISIGGFKSNSAGTFAAADMFPTLHLAGGATGLMDFSPIRLRTSEAFFEQGSMAFGFYNCTHDGTATVSLDGNKQGAGTGSIGNEYRVTIARVA